MAIIIVYDEMMHSVVVEQKEHRGNIATDMNSISLINQTHIRGVRDTDNMNYSVVPSTLQFAKEVGEKKRKQQQQDIKMYYSIEYILLDYLFAALGKASSGGGEETICSS